MTLRLKELREERELKQVEVGEAIKTSKMNIGRWENGKVDPSSSFVVKLADFFQVSADYLLGRTDDLGNIVIQGENNFPTSLLEQRLILDFRKLPAETQDNFAALFHNLAMGA